MSGDRPVVRRLMDEPDPAAVLAAFPPVTRPVLFDSALRDACRGRFSFFSADPLLLVRWRRVREGDQPFGPLRPLTRWIDHWPRAEGLGGFQGGLAGVLSYELGGNFETIPRAGIDEYRLPDLVIGLYDWAVVWDHDTGGCWFTAQRLAADSFADVVRRVERAAAGNGEVQVCAAEPPSPERRYRSLLDRLCEVKGREPGRADTAERPGASIPPAIRRPVPVAAIRALGGTSDFSREEYLRAVERVLEWIRAGDIFQANLSQRLVFPFGGSLVELYRRLRACNPAPFAGFFADEDWAILSASPERFIRCAGGVVQTRPIKGTRPRGTGPEADLIYEEELRRSAKDAAENVMIVDLLRNDLSRVCRPGSIRVTELCAVERYQTVQHLVSTVEGELAGGRDVWDLLTAALPGGSISGAPKIRAQQIIAELEPTVRGPYCGNLVYYGPQGTFDSNILIRTFVWRSGHLQCAVGGGVVIDSDPQSEYYETLAKAEGMIRALRAAVGEASPEAIRGG
ncbi:MAG: anthranilate synthase component I family protein [Planctomycetota bacterium]|nr:MAG: anthranilate synthase component I family protein [Planctomycetota bacterium]